MIRLVAFLGILLILQAVHLAVVLGWCDRRTKGGRYYRLSPAGRRRFKRLVRMHAVLLSPILATLAAITRTPFSRRCFKYQGVAGPAGACSAESFRRAAGYCPQAEDVFIVTQMRSGTTLAQHLVFQVLSRGEGDIGRDGVALNALSPWLESTSTVDVCEAPLLGKQRRTRLIKTHLPAPLCPFSRQAKYVYVVRHPVSCFASCADFVRNNLGPFAPDLDELDCWFRSEDLMWWNTWTTHLAGWWRRAEREENVLLLRFEDLVDDPEAAGRRLAAFLDVPPLADDEMASVVAKCSFASMKAAADAFEMHPPHVLQATNAFFRSGRTDRFADVPPELSRKIVEWCRARCAADSIPIDRLYPDLAPERESQAGDEVCTCCR